MWGAGYITVLLIGFVSIALGISDFLNIPALNRAADIGHLYNALTDEFYLIKAVKEDFPVNFTYFINAPKVYYAYRRVRSFSDQIESFNLDVNAQVSLLFGRAEIGGSYNYLSETGLQSEQNQATLTYNTKVTTELLALNRLKVLQKIDSNIGRQFHATHLIIGIEWGTDCVFSILWKTKTAILKKVSGGVVNFALSSPKYSLEMETSFQSLKKSVNKNDEVDIKFYGNLEVGNISFRSFEDVEEYISKVPELSKNVNSGKGSPQRFIAISLNKLDELKRSRSSLKQKALKNAIEHSTTSELQTFQINSKILIDYKKQKSIINEISNYKKQAVIYEQILPTGAANELELELQNFQHVHGEFRLRVQSLLKKSRKSTVTIAKKYKTILQQYTEDKYGYAMLPYIRSVNTYYKTKIDAYAWLKSLNIHILNKSEILSRIIVPLRKKSKVNIFFSNSIISKDQNQWHRAVTDHLIAKETYSVYVDCDLKEIFESSCRHLFPNGVNKTAIVSMYSDCKPKCCPYGCRDVNCSL